MTTQLDFFYSYYDSPVGDLLLAGDANSLHYIGFQTGNRARRHCASWQRDDNLFQSVTSQLSAYFDGSLTDFSLSLTMFGTVFQKTVWSALREIPYGKTTTYSLLAKKIDRPRAYRAVGAANGANPLPIIIPCHRVIGADQSLTGFGGGIEIKKFLLSHEKSFINQ